jgi:hypothetical protein
MPDAVPGNVETGEANNGRRVQQFLEAWPEHVRIGYPTTTAQTRQIENLPIRDRRLLDVCKLSDECAALICQL